MGTTWKQTFLIGCIIISLGILFHGLLDYSNSQEISKVLSKTNSENQNKDGTFMVSTKNVPMWGEKDAPITIIEFSDFECPFCSKAYTDILPQLKKDYIDTGKLRFLYRNAPLKIHEHAKTKAIAALCAQEQKGDEAFYTYHNQLYEASDNSIEINQLLLDLAQKQKLTPSTFQKCIETNQKIHDQVDLDIADAGELGATGTPTWFIGKTNKEGEIINGIRVLGTQPYSVYRILINQLLSE